LQNTDIIRNKRKITAAVTNAKAIEKLKKEQGSFASYLWSFVHGKTIQHAFKREEDIPKYSKEAAAMSKDIKTRGFRFVGPTTCYAFMQGVGMVNDHIVSCFRYKEIANRRFSTKNT
jgi:DNA-3-methyladenine glycosylase I